MKRNWMRFVLFFIAPFLHAAELAPTRIEHIDSSGGTFDAHLFLPKTPCQSCAAIVLLHGGGWNEGDASWMYGQAERYTALGIIAVAVDYRLSDQKNVTPFDALADARNTIRWLRRNAMTLNLDRNKIAVLGTSAGGHLAAGTAVFDEPFADSISAQPNAVILRSPAVAIADSNWFRKLAGGVAQAQALSPDLHVHGGLPPMLILQGEKDNLTPAQGAQDFCDRLRRLGNSCELHIYPGVGHLFTRNLQNQEVPDYSAIDQTVVEDANQKATVFLRKQGFFQ